MARELADRRDRLSGREGDLAYLLERARFKGLTAVVSRPQAGKSWLSIELARRLSQELLQSAIRRASATTSVEKFPYAGVRLRCLEPRAKPTLRYRAERRRPERCSSGL
jgi:hypothetical protein